MYQIKSLDAGNYSQHRIHRDDRVWVETNCYVDVLVELIHALGFDPVAALPFTLAIDYEFDQWTFFKYPHEDLYALYGFEIQELNPWQGLAQHVESQVRHGRPVLVELDSYYLPDTSGTTYQCDHVKSTVAVNSISIAERRMGYFHGQGYYELQDKDFDQVFQLDGLSHDRALPPYIELVKLHQTPGELSQQQLLDLSLQALSRQLKRLPDKNPFQRFKEHFESSLEELKREGLDHFHLYSFATFRQYGACYELAHTYLTWLLAQGDFAISESASQFYDISQQTKLLQLKLARTIARNKPLDLSPLDDMAEMWQDATGNIRRQFSEAL